MDPSGPPDPSPRRDPDSERGMESVRRTSSLPSGVFRSASPSVERQLAGGVGDIFLRHMARTDRQAGTVKSRRGPDPDIEKRNRVEDDELRALVSDLRGRVVVSAPSIADNLPNERTWILADLAVHGTDRAREIAARELVDAFEDPAVVARLGAAVIERVATAIDSEESAGRPIDMLLHSVRLAARTAIAGGAKLS